MIHDEFTSAGFRYTVALLQRARLDEEWQKKHPKYRYTEFVEEAWAALLSGDDDRIISAAVNLAFPLYASNDDSDDALWFLQVSAKITRLKVTLPAVLGAANYDPVYYSIREIAELSGLSESPWRVRCQEGKVPGAMLVGNSWIIPEYIALLNRVRWQYDHRI